MPKVVNPDLKEVEKLGRFHVTYEELAAWFHVTKRTVIRWMENPEFAEALERGKAQGRISLRQAQMKAALGGDKTMLVWLGKQLLGQKDTVVTEHTGEMTINDGARERLISKLGSIAAAATDQQSDQRPN